MADTTQQKASRAYVKRVKKKQVTINPDFDSALLDAINKDDMSFSERCKQLLKEYYDIA